MIVKMKKVSLVLLDVHRDQSIDELGRLGVVHLEPMRGEGEHLAELKEAQARILKSEQLLPAKVRRPAREESAPACAEEIEPIIGEITSRDEDARRIAEEIERLSHEAVRLAPWGEFNPEEIRELREQGVDLRLYELSAARFREISGPLSPFVNYRGRAAIGCSIVGASELLRPEEEFPLPERGRRELGAKIAEDRSQLAEIRARLEELARRRGLLEGRRRAIAREIEYEEVRTGVGREERLAYLTGYVPAGRVGALEQAASANGWGLLVRDPEPGDPVPTLVENPKWIRIIRPMFTFLGLTPGYGEFDISPWFLIFFSVFFALLVGDAAYGLVFLAGTILARIRMPKAQPEFFRMMYVFSLCTIIWGAITGTWFGSEAIAHNALLSKLIIPRLYSFNSANNSFIMQLCFTIAVAHLTLAHLLNFAKKFPSLAAFADAGSIALVWGLYFLVIALVVGRPLSPATLPLVAGGFTVQVLFSEQGQGIGRGLLLGLAKLPLKLLNSVSSFSDIVSYVRLFAVGLATVAVAASFNAMAAGVGRGVAGHIAAALILVFGHSLNITLGVLALIVHGVRLNLLEFSGHLEMEWSGVAYRPFKHVRGELASTRE